MSDSVNVRRSKFADFWETLDALEVGETWEFKPEAFARCKTPAGRFSSLYFNVSGRTVRMLGTTRGYMFVRIE